MAEKTLNARIVHKHDVAANWQKATNFTPKQGEIIVYDKDATYSYERIKIGDGTTNVNALPFVTEHTHEELELLIEDNLSENMYTSGTTSTAFTYDNKQFYYIGTLSESLYNNSVVLQLKIKVNDYSSTIRYFTLPYSHGETLYAPYFTTRFTEMGTEAIYLNGADQTLNVQLATDDTNDLYIHHTLSSSIVTVQSVKKILGVVVVEDCIPDTIARVSDIPEQITVDEELSSTSTNPVQNKVVDAAISALNELVGDTAVSTQINNAVSGKANTSDLTSHTGNKSNPHGVTKSQVGLGNVPNVATNDQTPTYSDATTFVTLTSGEKLSVAFAKIKLAITNLINHIANVSNPHSVTKSQIGLGNVENKSSATIRGEITKANVTDALGYTPPETNTTYSAAGSSLGLVKTGGDVAISDGVITVNDDSHNHVIGNVDGLQGALDAKAAASTVTALQQLVGDTAVSTQISNAVSSYIPTSQKGVANGVAQLDANGKVPTAQLPSYVDDVIEGTWVSSTSFKNTSGSTLTGETGKIYVDTATNKTYRWSGSAYVEISASLALGTTSSTAYRGDYGNTAYTHSQKISGNPHGVTKSDVGLGNVENKSSATIRGELTKTNVTDALGYTPPTTNTTYSNATTSAAGLMSATDKSALDNLNTLVGDTAVATQIANAIAEVPAAFSQVTVGSTAITADLVNALILAAGTGIKLTASALTGKVTIAADVDNMEFITIADIDEICGATIQSASEVTF